MGRASDHPYGAHNFEVVIRVLESLCTTAVVLSHTFVAVEENKDEDDEKNDNGDDDVYDIDMSILISYSFLLKILKFMRTDCRSQWPRGLRRRFAAARLLRSWARIPPGAQIFVCCKCSVLPGRGLCDELITRPEEFYRLWCVVECDLETSRMRRP
jgi:hypothetical protein